MDRKSAEALLDTIGYYQQGYNSFKKANPTLSHKQIVEMTDSWWQGMMIAVKINREEKGGEFGFEHF